MGAPQPVEQNLRFLIHEVRKQLDRTRRFAREPSERLADRIVARDDYIDTLRSTIRRKVFELAGADDGPNLRLRAYDSIAANLEQLADHCESVIDQLAHIGDEGGSLAAVMESYFEELGGAMGRLEEAVFDWDVRAALDLCRSEKRIDKMYARDFRGLVDGLDDPADGHSTVTGVLILHYFERMGDRLLNVGEAVISSSLGDKIKLGQFLALNDALEDEDLEQSLDGVFIESAAETRSGCRIDRVRTGQGTEEERFVIFKDGRTKKLVEEKDGIERWAAEFPAGPPEVYSFQDHGDFGSILLEYLQGSTFEELLLSAPLAEVDAALDRIFETMTSVWRRTRRDEPISADFSGQLRKRIKDVFTLHADLNASGVQIGELRVPGFDELMARAAVLEAKLQAPFRVLIHGDFNVDNMLYDTDTDRVRLIDLHRSRWFDYVQDVSVFLVSNIRLQVFTAAARRRISYVVARALGHARRWAEEVGDTTFEARLCLGLARSFATSARFALDPRFAKALFLRARFLIEQLLAAPAGELEHFMVPEEVILD